MHRMLIGAAAIAALLAAGSASAQGYYDGGPRPPYATGVYVGVGAGDPDCSFTLAGAHAGVTVLGINIGGGARVGLPTGCGGDYAGPVSYSAPPPQPYYGGQVGYQPPYPPPGYGYQGGYAAPAAYPAPAYGYPPQPCGCQPVVYQPY